jgi:hypothetical protein
MLTASRLIGVLLTGLLAGSGLAISLLEAISAGLRLSIRSTSSWSFERIRSPFRCLGLVASSGRWASRSSDVET